MERKRESKSKLHKERLLILYHLTICLDFPLHPHPFLLTIQKKRDKIWNTILEGWGITKYFRFFDSHRRRDGEVRAIIQMRERKEYILNQLEEKSAVTVAELSEALALSEVSIRKLLMTMEQEGKLRRTWGGAVCAHGSLREFSHQEKLTRHLEEKKAIARAAYDCIADGEAIFLDCGTTTIQLARLIIEGPKRNILVCTNAINIAMELAKARDIHSIVIGGELRGNILSCVGSLAEWSLQRLFFDKGFVSGNHFTIEHGFSAPIFSEAELKRRVLTVSKEKFILMDYSKYGDDSLVQIAPAEEIDTLITDWRAPEELVQSFGEKGLKVIRAPRG